jgi:PQQ-dependent catabolism-associated CXXCW motif protein
MRCHAHVAVLVLGVSWVLAAAVAPALGQNALSFPSSEAGKGKKCYFGECSDAPNSHAPGADTTDTSQPPPAPTPSLPPLGTLGNLPAPPPNPAPAPVSANYADELTNFGIPPRSFLQTQVGGPTPTAIPGGRVVTTDQLRVALQSGKRDFILIDAFYAPGHQTIPGAYNIPLAGTGGNFLDYAQGQVFIRLMQLTNARSDYPIVFFCEGARCWESYNAALRAVNMGFSNVYWYRGGIDAWQEAGLPMAYGN